jgi:prepilin-type N-terminal cleavage/methylation domain-containing protein
VHGLQVRTEVAEQAHEMSKRRARRGNTGNDEGFTLVEMVISIAISAFAFAALGALLVGSMRSIAIHKARAQGNEVATEGIEDLQRLPYEKLVLCSQAAAPRPSGFTDAVLVVCGGGQAKYAPCGGTASITALASEEYNCVRTNITYRVRRFIAFGDPAHTEKRLAVLVDWQDSGGNHLVSQQSSLRIPTQSAFVGSPPPSILTASAPSSIPLNATGRNLNNIVLSATTSGLPSAATNTVIAAYSVLNNAGEAEQQSVTLTFSSGSWSTTILAGTAHFGNGRQPFVFTAIRGSDGKLNSLVTLASDIGNVALAPPMTTPNVSSNSIPITATGDLAVSSFTVSTTTDNISPEDTVTLLLPTTTGVVSLAMGADPLLPACQGPTCTTTWTATISQSNGYRFEETTTQRLHVVVAQRGPGGSFAFDAPGSTNAGRTSAIDFHQ